MSCFLPTPSSGSAGSEAVLKRHKLGIYYFVLAGVIFRSELALLLGCQLLFLLLTRSTPILMKTLVLTGLSAAILALLMSVPVDSYFWQKPVWPELSGFIYNVFEGKSSDWGTSPPHAYLTSFLPKLLLNPAILLVGIPVALIQSSSRRAALGMLIPSLAFVVVYSIQPHKEARFIIYVVPPLTACAALGAAYITTHRGRSIVYQVFFLALCLSIPASFVASIAMLVISSLNYPGGEALYTLHRHVTLFPQTHGKTINIHMDVPSCMTGVSRFQQEHPTAPFFTAISNLVLPNSTLSPKAQAPNLGDSPELMYDKEENVNVLLTPDFWMSFDYVLTATPETVIGKWDVLSTIYGYAGIEFLRPGQIAASNLPVHSKQYMKLEGVRVDEGEYDESFVAPEDNDVEEDKDKAAKEVLNKWFDKARKLGYYGMIREACRIITGGWWIGPKMEAKIWILRRVSDGITGEWGNL